MPSILSTMQQRRSVRNFDSATSVPPDDVALLTQACNTATAPFDGRFDLRIVSVENLTVAPSTYGVISGAQLYMLVAFGNDTADALAAGFAAQSVVLQACSLKLDTCWIGGTFRRSSFENAAHFNNATTLRAIVAIGTPATKPRFISKIMRRLANSDSRRPMQQLFTLPSGAPLPPDNPFYYPLSFLRIAPSALNKQPWRAVVRDNRIDFSTVSNSATDTLCLGIALAQFDIARRNSGIRGRYLNTSQPGVITSFIASR